jgi:hypothetical protein
VSGRETWRARVAQAYQFLQFQVVEKPEGKRPLGRPRHRWVDNIRMDLGEVGWGDVDWSGLAEDRNRRRALVNCVPNSGLRSDYHSLYVYERFTVRI